MDLRPNANKKCHVVAKMRSALLAYVTRSRTYKRVILCFVEHCLNISEPFGQVWGFFFKTNIII